MAFNNRNNYTVYLQDGTTLQIQNPPVVTVRAPGATDIGEIGDTWINTATATAYTLCSITAAGAVWATSPATGLGAFADVTMTGDLTLTGASGDITSTNGDLAMGGNITCTDITTGGAVIVGTNLTVTGATAVGDIAITGDFDLTAASQFDVTTTVNAASAIYLHANGGVLETINIRAEQGTGADAITLTSAVGGATITTGLASDDSFNIASTGGVDIDAAMQINVATSEANADSFVMISAGGMDITATGAAASDIDVTCTAGSINITAGESDTNAMILNASGANGGVKIQAGANGVEIGNQADCAILDMGDVVPTAARTITIGGGLLVGAGITDTIDIGVDGVTTDATAVKTVNIATGPQDTGDQTVNILSGVITSGVATVNIASDTGTKGVNIGNVDGLTTITVQGITNINDNANVNTTIGNGTSTGSVFIGNAAAGDITLDTAAGISLDSATASNFTVTGVADLTLSSAGGSVVIDGSEAAVDAIQLTASDVAGGLTINVGTGGITAVNTGALSLAGTLASDITVTGADLTLESAGGFSLIGTADAVLNNAIDLDATAGGFSFDGVLYSNMTVTGAGEDLALLAVGGSVQIDGSEAVATAINLTASDVAGGITFNTGTGGVTLVNTGALALAGTLTSNITVTGAAADLQLYSIGGSLDIYATEDDPQAILLQTDGGLTEAIELNTIQGTDPASIYLLADVGGITLEATGLASDDAINLIATAGGIDMDAAGQINLASSEAAADSVVITASNAAGGLEVNTNGLFSVVSEGNTIASPVVISTINTNVMSVLATGFTTAAGADEVFTFTNALVSATSRVVYGCCNEGANDAQMHITRVLRQAGSFVVTVHNDGAAALNGNLEMTFWFLS